LKGYLVEAMKDKMKNIQNVKPQHKKAHENEESSIPTKNKNIACHFQDIQWCRLSLLLKMKHLV